MLKFNKSLDALEAKLRQLNFGEGIRHLKNINTDLKSLEKDISPLKGDYIRNGFGILLDNLNQIVELLEYADKKNREISTARETESLTFEKKFKIVRQIHDLRNTIARLEKERDNLDKTTEAQKFEARFRLLKKIQAMRSSADSLEKEKSDIENKGERATAEELARKLDIVARILDLRRSATKLEQESASPDAQIKSQNLGRKLKLIEDIQKAKDSIKSLEHQIALIDAESSEESERKVRIQNSKDKARNKALQIISKNQEVLGLLMRKAGYSEKNPDQAVDLHKDPLSGADINLRPLAEQLNRFGCQECADQISNLYESLSLFKEMLGKRINPEIGAFERYFVRGMELYDTILSELEYTATYLKAAGADKEWEIADRLRMLNLKQNKDARDYDEIFENTPKLDKIQEARAKVFKRIKKLRKGIEMIKEEAMKIALRQGYQTNFDFAQTKFEELASKRNKDNISLEVAMRNFQETCTLNKRILDRFEEQSIQHRRHHGN